MKSWSLNFTIDDETYKRFMKNKCLVPQDYELREQEWNSFEDNFTRITKLYEVPDKDWIQSKTTEYLEHLNPHNRKFRRAIKKELTKRYKEGSKK